MMLSLLLWSGGSDVYAQFRSVMFRTGYALTKTFNRTDLLNLRLHHKPGWAFQQSATVSSWWGPEIGAGVSVAVTRLNAGYETWNMGMGIADSFVFSSISLGYWGAGVELLMATRKEWHSQRSYAVFAVGITYDRLYQAAYENPQLPTSNIQWMRKVVVPWMLTLRFRGEVRIPLTNQWHLGGYLNITRSLRNYENISYLRAHADELPHDGYLPPFGTIKDSPPDLLTRNVGRFWIIEPGLSMVKQW